MSNPVVHFEIGGHDLPALREFYGKAFGWSISDAGPDYALVAAGGSGIGGGLMRATEQMPRYVTVYIQVDNLRGALAEVSALGGATLVEPTPINDMSSFALFRDPEGNIVGLLESTGSVGDHE